MLDLSSSNWSSHASGRSLAMSTNSKDIIFLRRVSGRGHRELAVLAAAGATIVEGRSDVAGKLGIAALWAVRGGGILGIRGPTEGCGRWSYSHQCHCGCSCNCGCMKVVWERGMAFTPG